MQVGLSNVVCIGSGLTDSDNFWAVGFSTSTFKAYLIGKSLQNIAVPASEQHFTI